MDKEIKKCVCVEDHTIVEYDSYGDPINYCLVCKKNRVNSKEKEKYDVEFD
jgi:hypothetical protein